jgi:hypothetical protein
MYSFNLDDEICDASPFGNHLPTCTQHWVSCHRVPAEPDPLDGTHRPFVGNRNAHSKTCRQGCAEHFIAQLSQPSCPVALPAMGLRSDEHICLPRAGWQAAICKIEGVRVANRFGIQRVEPPPQPEAVTDGNRSQR